VFTCCECLCGSVYDSVWQCCVCVYVWVSVNASESGIVGMCVGAVCVYVSVFVCVCMCMSVSEFLGAGDKWAKLTQALVAHVCHLRY
jgi:hypothetical protein